jgi:hypothetical protein
MLTAVLKAVKMLLSCCPKSSQDAVVLTALKAVQDAEKNHPHKDQVQRLIPIIPCVLSLSHGATSSNNLSGLYYTTRKQGRLLGHCSNACAAKLPESSDQENRGSLAGAKSQ